MNKSLIISCFLLLFIVFQGFCQQNIADLKRSLKQQTNPAAQMHIKLQIGDNYQAINSSDSALYWYNEIIPKNFSDSLVFAKWNGSASDAEKYYVTVSLARSGTILAKKNQIEQAALNLEKAYDMAIKINDLQLAVYSSDNLAVIFARAKQPQRAGEFFEKSLSIYQELNDEKGIVFCLGNLGAINANQKNYYKAADYYEQLLNIQQQANSPLETLDDLINIAALYNQLEETEKAKAMWVRAFEVASQVQNYQKTIIILTNLGALSYKQGDMKMAQQHYNGLLEAAKKTESKDDELLALNNLAIISYNLNDLNKSLQHWESALNLGLQIGRGQVVLDALINLSNINYQLEDFEKASSYFERYLAIGKQIGDLNTMAQSYISIAEIQERIKNYDKAREYYKEAIKLYQLQNDANGLANVNVLIGKTFQREQRYFTALEFFRANLNAESTLDPKNVAASYQGIADISRLQMQYPNALENYQKALDLHLNLDDNSQAAVCLNAMGLILQVTGDFPKAVSYYETALRLVQKMGNKEGTAAIYNNLGVVYRQLGDLPKARDSYQRALEINIEIDNQEGASYSYNNLGIIYEQSGDYEKANELYEKSLAIKQNTEDKLGLATSLMNMGNVYKHLKNPSKAEEFYNKSFDISKEIYDKQGMALALGSLAALKLETYDYNTAIDYANRSLTIAEEIDMKSVIKEAYRQLAWAYNATFVPEWAEESYISVISMNHEDINRNFSILSESEKELFFRTVAEDFDRFHSFALHRKITNHNISQDVYNNLLKNKGLLLKSSTAMRNAILSSNDAKLIELFEKWIQVKQEIAKQYTMSIEERTANPEDLEKQANELERSLVRSSSEFSDFEKSLKVDWTSVKNGLKEGEAAIEFTHFAHGRDSVMYCAMIVTHNCDNPLMIPLFEEKQLQQLLGSFAGNNYQYINSIYGKNSQDNSALYNLIWKPMESSLGGISTVYVSPTGLLHKISFSAISKELNHYLIDDYKLHVLSTTANVTTDIKLAVNEDMSVGLFGGIAYTTVPATAETWNYLKGTLDETLMIKQLMQGQLKQVETVTDSLATEEKFKELAPQSHVLHVATHGFFFPDPEQIRLSIESVKEVGEIEFRGGSPTFGMTNFVQNQNPLMRSGLVFAGVNDFWSGAKAIKGDDGVLTALEVINIDLRKNMLVVMSACETGLGDIAGSEGVYGLQRAFKMAGTNFLIMSLWQVPDKETSEFMQNFYTLLIQEKDLQKAFTQTQSKMRQQYDPYFWAAFVLLE
jgi:tetratricopeptide (TPR) repeat protein